MKKPRKFIVSDLHGNGNIYNSIMGYIDNIKKHEDVIVYINGDLIDRGPDSARMLLDVKRRIESGEKIVYLGGNHELMMHQVFKERRKQQYSDTSQWYFNGGAYTDSGLSNLLKNDRSKLDNVGYFVSNLNIYQVFEERINKKPILLVHACSPATIKDECDLKIKDDNQIIDKCTWTRIGSPRLYYADRIGSDKYFTIVGHTPLSTRSGYEYYDYDNYLNIDGGCAVYMNGMISFDHTPLVEVIDGHLKILTFNNNNEIARGHIFVKHYSIPMSEQELKIERAYLNNEIKVKKLVRNKSGILYYKG